MLEHILHAFLRLFGSPPAQMDSNSYYETVGALIGAITSVSIAICAGIVVYLMVTRRQQVMQDSMRASDRLKFIHELEEEFRNTIHTRGFLAFTAVEAQILGDIQPAVAADQAATMARVTHQLKRFFDLANISFDGSQIDLRAFGGDRYLVLPTVPQELIAKTQDEHLKALITGRSIAVDDQMLSRIAILFHRLDRAIQSRLFVASDAAAFWRLVRYGDRLYFTFLLRRLDADLGAPEPGQPYPQSYVDTILGRYGRVWAMFFVSFELSGYRVPLEDFCKRAHDDAIKLALRFLASPSIMIALRDGAESTANERMISTPGARHAVTRRLRRELDERRRPPTAAPEVTAA